MSFINRSLFSILAGTVFSVLAMTATANLEGEADDESEFEDETGMYDDKLPWASDLMLELQRAACSGKPLVLMFGSSECPYCSLVRSLYMVPLQDDKRYSGIVVRELEIDSDTPVKDFSGKLTTMRKLAAEYGVYLVPTVMVFGTGGKLAGKPVVGISNEDFYGFYLDQAIDDGVSMVKSANAAPSAAPAAYACD